jgi:hypothetical protein
MPTLNNAHGLVIGIADYANIRNLTWESPAWPPSSAKVRTGSLQQPDDSRSLPRSLWGRKLSTADTQLQKPSGNKSGRTRSPHPPGAAMQDSRHHCISGVPGR